MPLWILSRMWNAARPLSGGPSPARVAEMIQWGRGTAEGAGQSMEGPRGSTEAGLQPIGGADRCIN